MSEHTEMPALLDGVKNELSKLMMENNSKLSVYGKTLYFVYGKDCINNIPLFLLDDFDKKDILFIISYNPMSCCIEIEFYKVKDEVFRELLYFTNTKQSTLNKDLENHHAVLHILSIFCSPVEKNSPIKTENLMENLRKIYPQNYFDILEFIISRQPTDIRIVCNNCDIANELTFYGWTNIRVRATRYSIT